MRACPPSGRGRGTGPDGDKFRRGGTQETLGGAEAKRSPEEGLCPALAKRPDIKKKPAKNLFLVGLFLAFKPVRGPEYQNFYSSSDEAGT